MDGLNSIFAVDTGTLEVNVTIPTVPIFALTSALTSKIHPIEVASVVSLETNQTVVAASVRGSDTPASFDGDGVLTEVSEAEVAKTSRVLASGAQADVPDDAIWW
jgi:hypothetical protein